MVDFQADDLLVKPVINISNETIVKRLKLGQDTSLVLDNITISTSIFDKQEPSATQFSMEDVPTLISDIDTVPLANEADDTSFDRIYQWIPDTDVLVYKTILRAAFALNVSVDTSGSWDLNAVRYELDITDPQNNRQGNILLNKQITAALAAITDVGTLIFIVNDIVIHPNPIKIKRGLIWRLRLILGTSLGVGTSQAGVLPLFPFHPEAANKQFAESVLEMHYKNALDNVFPILRDQSVAEQLDYGGVKRDGVKR